MVTEVIKDRVIQKYQKCTSDATILCSTLGKKQFAQRMSLSVFTSHKHELNSTPCTRKLAVPRTPSPHPPPLRQGTWPGPLAHSEAEVWPRKIPECYKRPRPGTQSKAWSRTTLAPGGSRRVSLWSAGRVTGLRSRDMSGLASLRRVSGRAEAFPP